MVSKSIRQRVLRRRMARPAIETLEIRKLLSTYTVTTANDAGVGSLRQAILDSNNHAGGDSIVFNIPASGFTPTIQPLTPLPHIFDTSSQINGANQGSTGVFDNRVVLDGSQLGSAGGSTVAIGLVMDGNFNRAFNLRLNNWGYAGLLMVNNQPLGLLQRGTISAVDATNCSRASGSTTDGYGNLVDGGIVMTQSSSVTITSCTLTGNKHWGLELNGVFNSDINNCTIKGSGLDGVVFAGACTANTLQTSFINTSGGAGVRIDGFGSAGVSSGNYVDHCQIGFTVTSGTSGSPQPVAAANTIGVLLQGKSTNNVVNANMIAGNNSSGVRILDTGSDGNSITSNRIGQTDIGVLANTGDGVYIDHGQSSVVTGNTITNNGINGVDLRTTFHSLIRGNAISANAQSGIVLELNGGADSIGGSSTGGDGNTITVNGQHGIVAADGSNSIRGNTVNSNNGYGVLVNNGASNNVIGGSVSNGYGNVIDDNGLDGIGLLTAPGNIVQGNRIGLTATGATFGNHFKGIGVFNTSPNNTIGGGPDLGNIISGNATEGISINNASTGTIIRGNYIGTNVAGTANFGNNTDGIYVNTGCDNTIIGGESPGDGNLISGNNGSGLNIFSASNSIWGNSIGTNAAGTGNVGNGINGITLGQGATLNAIGGPVVVRRNLISGNNGSGVVLNGAGTTSNTIAGNYIGTNAAGNGNVGNGSVGVRINPGADGNTIGGTTSFAGNVISGNHSNGLLLVSNSNFVQGNLVGTDYTGLVAIPNLDTGVSIAAGASRNTIGGTNGGRNTISGNGGSGVGLYDNSTANNVVAGNLIGLNALATGPLGNVADGIQVAAGTTGPINNSLGLTGTNGANIIAFNGGRGVRLVTGSGNAVRGNQIYENTALGIDIDPIGDNVNDPGDSDVGANMLQNKPTLTSVTDNGNGTFTILGTLNTTPNANVTIDLYSTAFTPAAGATAAGHFLTSLNILTDNSGNAGFGTTFTGQVALVTATASVNGNTSEISNTVGTAAGTATPGSTYIEIDNGATVQSLFFSGGTLDLNSDPAKSIGPISLWVNPLGVGSARVNLNYATTLTSLSVFQGGSVSLNPHPLPPDGTPALNVTGAVIIYPGATVSLNPHPLPPRVLMKSGSLRILSTGHLNVGIDLPSASGPDASPPLTGTANSVIETAGLTLDPGSVFDLNDATLLVDYTAGDSPAASVRTALTTGRNGGTWDGTGLISTAAHANTNGTLGYAESADLFSTATGTIAGETVDSTEIVIRYTIQGDTNLNRTVGFDDLLTLAQNYGKLGQRFSQGDLNYSANGAVDFDDLLILAQHYNTSLITDAPLTPSKPSTAATKKRAGYVDYI